jgi:tRNA(fMet)-specific endonuclease VapC
VATLIDASVLIAAERGRLDLDAVVAQEADEVIALAAITASELLHGIHRAAKPAPRARREAFVEQVLATVAISRIPLWRRTPADQIQLECAVGP